MPGGHARGVPRRVAVQVGERLAHVIFAIAIGIGIGLETGAVAVGPAGLVVVVVRVVVFDAVPHLANGGIGAHHHAVFGAGEHVAVVGGPLDVALRGFGVEIEGLLEGIIDRAAVVAIQEGPGGNEVEAVLQPRAGLAIVVVRAILDGGRIDIGDLPDAHHLRLARDVIRAAGPDDVIAVAVVTLLAGRPNLVAKDRARRHGRHLRLPPVVGVRGGARPGALDDAGGGIAGAAARPFGPGRAVRGVVQEHAVPRNLRGLDVDEKRLVGRVGQRRPELRTTRTIRPVLGPLRIVVDPRHGGRAVPVVAAGGKVGAPAGLADGGDVGFRAGGTELGAGRFHRGELFAPDALDEIGLLVAEVHVVDQRGRVVTRVAAGMVGGVEVHAAVEFQQNIAGGAVYPRHKGQVGHACCPGNINEIGKIG